MTSLRRSTLCSADKTGRVRVAVLSDLSELETLQRNAFVALGKSHYTDHQIQAALKYVQFVPPDLLSNGRMFVIENDASILASGGWSDHAPSHATALSTDQKDASTAIVRAIAVRPGFERRGLATRIMTVVESDAIGFGFKSLELSSTLVGVPLYERAGFCERARGKAMFPCGTTLDLVLMRKRIGD